MDNLIDLQKSVSVKNKLLANFINKKDPIDNIFSNVIDPDIISGNLTATISDHLPQFAIIPNMFDNISGNKSKFMKEIGPNLIEKILF